jgi:hypothetical protein
MSHSVPLCNLLTCFHCVVRPFLDGVGGQVDYYEVLGVSGWGRAAATAAAAGAPAAAAADLVCRRDRRQSHLQLVPAYGHQQSFQQPGNFVMAQKGFAGSAGAVGTLFSGCPATQIAH